ncbi:hypothetical protein PROP_02300 [Propionicimonas sp. T2.31MG-18]|uniref:hypothetical protein n=1 Tax=Propionicimonas sp. T2.31MG-18 TaxID=3157620 RepID=UPI0035E517F0
MRPPGRLSRRSSGRRAPDADLRAAWLSLLLVAPCFVAAYLLAVGITSLLGYADATAVPSWMMLATAPAFLCYALPTIPTWRFGNRARLRGVRHALVPFGIAVIMVMAVILLIPYPLRRWP